MVKIALLLCVLSTASMAANPADFPETTLGAFEAKHKSDGPGFQFATPLEPLSIRASAKGKFRPLSEPIRAFLKTYVATLGHTMTSADLSAFREEVLVNELGSGRGVWMPLQAPIAEAMKKEMKPDGAMKLLVRHFGWRETEPVYVLIDFAAFDDGAVGTISTHGPEPKTWASVCKIVGCANKRGQFLNPPFTFHLEGTFTGKKRPIAPGLAKHMTAYDEGFPGTFQIPVAKLMSFFTHEAEIKERATGQLVWVPLQANDIGKWVDSKASAPMSLYVAVYGTDTGRLHALGVETKKLAEPASLLRRRVKVK